MKDIEPLSRVFVLFDRMKHQLCGLISQKLKKSLKEKIISSDRDKWVRFKNAYFIIRIYVWI